MSCQILEDQEDLLVELLEDPSGNPAVREALDAKLARASILSASRIPADLVVIGSTVRFADERLGVERVITLVAPGGAGRDQAEPVSVLSPLGSLLLGLRVGQRADWQLPNRQQVRRLIVLAVLAQPDRPA